jgi:hypothetical protein
LKSKDGTTCELRPYLLEGSLIYFPFASVAVFIAIICLVSSIATKHRSMIISNLIALLSIVEMATIGMIYY